MTGKGGFGSGRGGGHSQERSHIAFIIGTGGSWSGRMPETFHLAPLSVESSRTVQSQHNSLLLFAAVVCKGLANSGHAVVGYCAMAKARQRSLDLQVERVEANGIRTS